MAKNPDDQPVVRSVLDRLMDSERGAEGDYPRSSGAFLRDRVASVRRDLENLLNTRWRCVGWSEGLDELDASLANYGIPDITAANMGSIDDREQLRRVVERAICQFEPRFKSVKVEMLANDDRADRTLRFRIEALLHAEPAPEPVVFDTELEPESGQFKVENMHR